MSSAEVAGKEVTMGKLKRKEQSVSSIWKVESLGYLALKGTESDSLGTLTTNGFSIASWHQFVCTACSYLLQSVDWEGLTLKKKAAVGPLSYLQNQLESITLAFIFFVVVLPNLFCQHMRDAKLNIQSSFAINFSCLL